MARCRTTNFTASSERRLLQAQGNKFTSLQSLVDASYEAAEAGPRPSCPCSCLVGEKRKVRGKGGLIWGDLRHMGGGAGKRQPSQWNQPMTPTSRSRICNAFTKTHSSTSYLEIWHAVWLQSGGRYSEESTREFSTR